MRARAAGEMGVVVVGGLVAVVVLMILWLGRGRLRLRRLRRVGGVVVEGEVEVAEEISRGVGEVVAERSGRTGGALVGM